MRVEIQGPLSFDIGDDGRPEHPGPEGWHQTPGRGITANRADAAAIDFAIRGLIDVIAHRGGVVMYSGMPLSSALPNLPPNAREPFEGFVKGWRRLYQPNDLTVDWSAPTFAQSVMNWGAAEVAWERYLNQLWPNRTMRMRETWERGRAPTMRGPAR